MAGLWEQLSMADGPSGLTLRKGRAWSTCGAFGSKVNGWEIDRQLSLLAGGRLEQKF